MTKSNQRRAVSVCLLLLAAGCAGNKLGKPVAQFPSRAELEEAARAQPEVPPPPFRTKTVDHWVLQTQVPEPGSAYPNDAPGDAWLLQYARAAKITASPELRCAATETARFYAEQGAFPDGTLRTHLVARCGSTLGQTDVRTLPLEPEEAPSAADLPASLSQRLAKLLASRWPGDAFAGPHAVVGLGFAQGQGRASFVLYRGARDLTLEGFTPLVDGDHFTVQGQWLFNLGPASALVTQGRYGVAKCEPDARAFYPKLAFVCPMLARDEAAIVEVVTRLPKRLLPYPALHAMVRRSPGAALTYHPDFSLLAQGSGDSAAGGASFQESLLAAVNRVRSAARLPPLLLEPQQSKFNARLVPRLVAAAYADDLKLSDRLQLGALAGWDVPGLIGGGSVYIPEERSRESWRWLGSALDDPLGRYTFLRPDVSRIAIGAASRGTDTVALVTTYALLESPGHEAEEDDWFDELVRVRAARGLSAPRRRARGKELSRALEQITQGELTSLEALESALAGVKKTTRLPLGGSVTETSDPSLMHFPPQLLTTPYLELELGIAHYEPDGGAWAQYAVLHLFTAKAGPRYQAALPEICHKPMQLSPSDGTPAPAASPSVETPDAPTREAHALLAIQPTVKPYKPVLPAACVRGAPSAILRICVSAEGAVVGMSVLKGSLPIIDSQLPTVIGRWRYHPYLREGKPTSFCYELEYGVQ
ncbi:MAG TPA: hypothetical protein VJU61_04835 [Polyangiaceae bacterium]|nr:hypothetical protein [Polyangiaceae bacterium]